VRRREFIGLLGGAAAWPLAAHAQADKSHTIGFLGALSASTSRDWVAAFLRRLHKLGWNEGRNIAIEYRWAEGRNERLAEFAAEFVRLKGRYHRHTRNGAIPRSKESHFGHSDRIRNVRRPCRYGSGRESGATGRQCHRPIASAGRDFYQTTRTPTRSRTYLIRRTCACRVIGRSCARSIIALRSAIPPW
jgi:hypothetical protein